MPSAATDGTASRCAGWLFLVRRLFGVGARGGLAVPAAAPEIRLSRSQEHDAAFALGTQAGRRVTDGVRAFRCGFVVTQAVT